MKVSIFQNKIVYWVDCSDKKDCLEVREVDEKKFFESRKPKQETKEQPTIDIQEEKVKEVGEMIVKKQALEMLGEDTKEVDTKITELVTW